MRCKLLIGGLLASALIVPAFAQSTPPAPANQGAPAATQAPARPAATAPKPAGDQWRASKLNGLNVYNDQNEKIGDITELLIDKSGKVSGVVIGAGGFLGMGRHDVMVEMSKLKFVNEPVKTSATTTTTTTTTGTANRPAPAGQQASTTANKWQPDHAVLTGVTKDQLKAMPAFKFD